MSYNFCNGFLAKCFETKILWNLERPIITTAPAWPPSLLYRLDCEGGGGGGIHITNTYFRQQPANQRRDTDCLQYLKSDIVIYKQQNSFDRIQQQQPANQCRDSDGLLYLKSDIVICKNSLSILYYTIDRSKEFCC